MAHITLNTNTALTSAALTLPDNVRIIVIDADTEEETADLTIHGAESLTITGEGAQIATVTDDAGNLDDEEYVQAVIDEMLNMLNVSPRNTDEDSADSDDDAVAAAPAILTAIHEMLGADDSYTIRIEYDNTTNTYTDPTTDTEIAEGAIIDIIDRACETEASVLMRFNIPGHGVTTFTGNLISDYYGYDGITLVSRTGGAYVLSSDQKLTDDMSVLEEATFTFIGDADILFANLDVRIIDIDEYEGRTTNTITNTDTEDEGDDDADTTAGDTAAYQRVRTFDADEQLYVSIDSHTHDLSSDDIHRIITYAVAHSLSARMNGVDEPYVGRLQDPNTDADNGVYTFVDKKFGAVQIDLDNPDGDSGFTTLEIYSDTDMRRRGFAGTNHTDYTEISIAEMVKHINTALDV